MSTTVALRTTENGAMVASHKDRQLGEPTPAAQLPRLEALQKDPFGLGEQLTAALGGDEVLALLAADPDRLLLLDCDEQADQVAWEFATTADRQFLGVRFGLLRQLDVNAPPADPAPAPQQQHVHFIALAADPLVDEQGQPRDGYRLALDTEMKTIRRVLADSGVALQASRVPPTKEALRKALLRGPALLHLSCHGNVVDTEHGEMAVLLLEDNDGGEALLLGRDLTAMAPPGVLRLVLLSACHTASGDEARLARALVRQGVPLAIGMQGKLLDALSDDLAESLYATLLSGQTAAEALRQARQALADKEIGQVGLPVGYVAGDAWRALPTTTGQPQVGDLRLPGRVNLSPDVQPPRPLLGRNGELHGIAKLYSQDKKVVTIAGTGGMGKTALAASFAERFAWRWGRDGVVAISFAAGDVDDGRFRAEILEALGMAEAARELAEQPAVQTKTVLAACHDWEGLLLLDNYESVMQGLEEETAAALEVHRLVYQIAEGGTDLLITSREQPAKLPGEQLFPEQNALHGLPSSFAVALFLMHSATADAGNESDRTLAASVAAATEGHPLAIALLAGEWDESDIRPDDFLANWTDELNAARRHGLAGHHVTFATAFARTYDRLPEHLQTRLRALSIYEFPFFAEGAAAVWSLTNEDEDLQAAREDLMQLVRRSLLDVRHQFPDKTPATFRFQPAMRQEIARRVLPSEQPAISTGYAAYGVWLAKRGFLDIHKDAALAQLVRLSLDALDVATDSLTGTEQLWHVRRVAWLKDAYGETKDAFELLNRFAPPTLPGSETEADARTADSAIRHELAGLHVTRGDLDQALTLYQQCLEIDEQIGDQQGKATSLHQMAQIFVTRGDLDHALTLYQQGLEIDEQLGDQQGKAASLHQIALIFITRGDLNQALTLYQQSLQIYEQIGDQQGKAASLHQIALIFITRGDLDHALTLFQEGLEIYEQIGDQQGKAASLSGIANVYWERREFDEAQRLMEQAIAVRQKVGDAEGCAYDVVKLGQLAAHRGQTDEARAMYEEGLEMFERLGSPAVEQVREFIAALDGTNVGGPADAIATLLAQAKAAASRQDFDASIAAHEQAVELMREAGDGRDELVTLSVMLFNLAGYYQQAGRHDEAVQALEEVVALDEQTGHEDLESDRQALATARRMAAMTPEEREAMSGAGGLLASLSPEQRAELEAKAAESGQSVEALLEQITQQMQNMSPEERSAMESAARQQMLESLADQTRDAAISALRGEADAAELARSLRELAGQINDDQSLGSSRSEMVEYLRALAAFLDGQPPPRVPTVYAARFSAVQAATNSGELNGK